MSFVPITFKYTTLVAFPPLPQSSTFYVPCHCKQNDNDLPFDLVSSVVSVEVRRSAASHNVSGTGGFRFRTTCSPLQMPFTLCLSRAGSLHISLLWNSRGNDVSAFVPVRRIGRRILTTLDGLIVCELLECKRTAYPPVAQVGIVLNECVDMYIDPVELEIRLHLTWVRVMLE